MGIIGKNWRMVRSFNLTWGDGYLEREGFVMKKLAKLHIKLLPTERRNFESKTTTYQIIATKKEADEIYRYIEKLERSNIEVA